MSSPFRLRPFWIVVLCLAPWCAPATGHAGSAAGPDTASAATSPAAVQGRKTEQKRRKHGKSGSRSPGRSTFAAHRRERRHPIAAGTGKQPPNTAKVALIASPGPAQTPAAQRAMDDVRHMQIARAESAARREDLTNRWDTVNFLISGVDEQHYPQAGFWKVLSCYRRGRISEGDSTRQRCQLSVEDLRALDGERAVAMLLTSKNGAPALEDATLAPAATGRSEGVVNNAAYTGPGPTAPPSANP